MGAEQSENSREFSDPVETWERYGFRIKSTAPQVPGRSKLRMLENIRLMFNPEGIYHKINLPYEEGSRDWDDWGVTTYKFSAVIYPTSNEECNITFLAQLDNIIQWANKPEVDHILDILPPKDYNNWNKHPDIAQITKTYHIGNVQAVKNAEALKVDGIVLFCDKVPKKYKTSEGDIPQIFHNFNKDGAASSEISPDKLLETVSWLENNRETFRKALIADEYGLGRVGSCMVALIFASNPSLTYEEAFQFVLSRKEIYCNKGLKDSLLHLYRRD